MQAKLFVCFQSLPPPTPSGGCTTFFLAKLTLYSMGYLFLDNNEKIQEKFKLNFEYFWKYYGKWSICSKRANAPFSIFSNIWYFKGVKRRYYGVKGWLYSCCYVCVCVLMPVPHGAKLVGSLICDCGNFPAFFKNGNHVILYHQMPHANIYPLLHNNAFKLS